MRHAVLGPGGIGGLVGAVLGAAGEAVTMIVRPGTASAYPKEMTLESPFGNLRAAVSVAERAEGAADVLWITVKTPQLEEALKSVTQDFQVGAVIPLLNGTYHVARLRQRFGRDKVIPATIAVESERVAPGKIVQRSPFVKFGISKAAVGRLDGPLEIFRRFGFEVAVVDGESTLLWRKLVFLAPVALSTSAAMGSVGAVRNDPEKAKLLEASVREACAVGVAEGAQVSAETVIAAIQGLPAGMRSSMEKDVAAHKTTEVDAIAGPIIDGGAKYGIEVPATRELVEAVRTRTAEYLKKAN
jgi:2-dehydropantoate 2-reductase